MQRRNGRRIWRVAVALAVVGLAAAGLSGCDPASTLVGRDTDPVVLQGSAVPALQGIPPNRLVAFRYSGNRWVPVPVQVDERRSVTMTQIYNGTQTIGINVLAYADPGTFTGADPTATLDGDDEIAFMARDAGGPASGASAAPAGVVAGSGVEVHLRDPLRSGTDGYVYLFRSAGSLDPAAGADYVDYDVGLASGDYKTTYELADGPNPEDTRVATANYRHHFSDRWLSDRIELLRDGATGTDILDRHKALLGPTTCGRSEDTFNDAEGAFVTNRDGPVRAIRSYVGANSGPSTQRTHVFYERREDITTNLRVHAIPGVLDFFDYATGANGMTYANSADTRSVAIDGNPDTRTAGSLAWERVSGPHGGLVISHRLETNTGVGHTSYHLDDSTAPPDPQCTGDAVARGSSGPWINQNIPCTDPGTSGTGCATNFLTARRTLVVEGKDVSNATAAGRHQQVITPLTVQTSAWTP